MDQAVSRRLEFEQFTLDLTRACVHVGDSEVDLSPKAFDVLRHLAENAGRLVSKQELYDNVWPGVTVTDDSLIQRIRELRRVLGDDDHSLIKTVARRGYLLNATVSGPTAVAVELAGMPDAAVARPAATTSGASRPSSRVAQVASAVLACVILGVGVWAFGPWRHAAPGPTVLTMMAVPSVAVLPFKVIGEASSQGDAAHTLVDDITTELSRQPRGYTMRVGSASNLRAPVENPRAVGRELGVRYLVLGIVRREGDTRQANIQLVEAETGRPVWAQPYAFPASEMQSLIAVRIARSLGAQILRAESQLPLPVSPEAGHFVILGRYHMMGEWNVERNQQAIGYFNRAHALDPNSVSALQGYARTRVNHVGNRWAPEEQLEVLLSEAEIATNRAVTLDPRDPGLHVLRGAYLRVRGKYAEAVAAFEHAIHLNSTYPLAHGELGRAKIDVGRAGEALPHIEEALRLSPTDSLLAPWYLWAGMAEAHVERHRSAIDWLLKSRQANRAYPYTIAWLAIAHAELGQWEEARAYFEEFRARRPQFSISGWNAAYLRRNEAAAAQRARIAATLCRLGAPGCEVQADSER